MSGRPLHCMVSCEHAANAIPPAYRTLFEDYHDLLRSHRGYDAGALAVARELARELDAPLFAARTSRLLVDLNRSPGHPALFSLVTRQLPRRARDHLFVQHYLPYRSRVAEHIARQREAGRRVVHVSSHSFTPQLDETLRKADVAFLYDPARLAERALCLRWIAALQNRAPALRLRRNYPYRGRADGFCTWLRRQYGEADYLGIELEVNQRFALAGGPAWQNLRRDLAASLLQATEALRAADAPQLAG